MFTDIEGSTRLLDELGADAYERALADHRRLLRDAFRSYGGVEVDTQGDAFFVAFASADGAAAAALKSKEQFAAGPIRVRVGLHTGTPRIGREGYIGRDVHLGARIAAAGHGGQILLSQQTRDRLDVEVIDLGEHRLKDFAEPVWIYQLGSERFPPLKTISNTNLPRPASEFVGRDKEVSEVISLLRDGARMLTLTGPGGIGKTRLAIEAGVELVPSFRNGTFWVDLAAVRDEALVASTIGQVIGAQEELDDHIGEREMLLVLDNLEQVVAAAPELASLVESCPNLRLLSTSRQRLRVRNEVEYAVPPLTIGDAVELFRSRSGLVGDDAIAELCRRLDNLPLAVELAAARVSVLTPTQILERLSKRLDLLKGGRDAEARQQTLRATIEWSHELLSADERTLFARLAVFRGGCTLEAAEQIATADIDTLQSLVDKSLLRHVDARFVMLETIGEYASERLSASGVADELRRHHAAFFLALAEEAEPHLFSGSPREWLERLEGDLDNLRAALDWLEASAQTERVLGMAGALTEFWGMKGHLAEGRHRLEGALRADERPTAARAKALIGAADTATGTGDSVAARLRAEEGLALHRKLGNAWGTAACLLLIGIAANNAQDFDRALEVLDESIRLFGELGDQHYTMQATFTLAWTYGELGHLDRARALHEENLRRACALGDKEEEIASLESLAGYAADEGRALDALSMLEDAYRLNRELGHEYRIPIIVCRFGGVLAAAGRLEAAARVLSSGEALLEEMGSRSLWLKRMNERTRSMIRTGLDEAAFDAAWESGRGMTADDVVALAASELESNA
jgi:predicted ATPase